MHISVRATGEGSEATCNGEAVTNGKYRGELVRDQSAHKRVVEVEKHTGELCEATNHTRDSIHPEEQAV